MIFAIAIHLLIEFPGNLLSVFDAEALIRGGGLLLICLTVYAQTGLFFCFFVPSGVFVFTGGMFIATGQLQHSVFTVCACCVIACVSGCFTSYWFGWKAGPLLYNRKDSGFFRQKHLNAAKTFYEKYGQFALTLGILFPVTRTFAPVIAGIVRMNFGRFTLLVFIGSALWVLLFISGGYLIGSIPGFREYLPFVMTAIILMVTTPVVIRIIREFKKINKGWLKKACPFE